MGSIGEICKEIAAEKERANKNKTEGINIETANYLPALQEACMYLEQALDPKSSQNVIGCLYDASFSLGYYLNHA